MKRTKPPFRADHVGSLLRPKALHEARAKRALGEITAEKLKEIEDREIAAVIKKQEDVGLEAITDGEFRRSWWHYDFLAGLSGQANALILTTDMLDDIAISQLGGDLRHTAYALLSDLVTIRRRAGAAK